MQENILESREDGNYESPLWTKFRKLHARLQNESVADIARSSGIGGVYCSFNQVSKPVEIAHLAGAIIFDRLSEICCLGAIIFDRLYEIHCLQLFVQIGLYLVQSFAATLPYGGPK